jgi:hypothetical protein
MKHLIAMLSALLGGTADAQQILPPYVYAYTIGTTQMQALPANAARKRAIFINPNATALIAVCPSSLTRSTPSVPTAAKIGGPGCSTILPYGELVIDAGLMPGPTVAMNAPWVAIADTANSALTIWEFE